MEESLILSKFDRLVESGLVLYDDKQQIIEHIDGDLKPTLPTSQAPPKPNGDTQEPDRRDGSDISTTGFEIATTDTHILIANKFSFSRPHLMLLTLDGHRRQYEALNETDLDGAWRILNAAETDYVAFYNCGRDGGCSRLHKHLQVMPLPANSFAAFLDSPEGRQPETRVPFEWFYRRLEGGVDSGTLATEVGGGRGEHAASAPSVAVCPHNMILTRRWMLVLPRRRGAVNKEAGVNSLGMLGIIAVATTKEIDSWVRLGLTKSLAELGVPKGI
ncbi:hypothetical protein BDV33DRAFT_227588 [Aspergillus novoparasiticus]|uniref:Uncharacterized protein n=1 Tax=Aspergillus novoparasiticus TaxID=986946 RepID=A0A5N6EDH0_9EURO|nr:hypothetical protein BDV33DRAFT_227588 [Aspergillus novoparasiticus]